MQTTRSSRTRLASPSPRPMLRAGVHACAGLLAVLAASCAATDEAQEVSDLIRGGDFRAALALAERRANETPDDPAVRADLETARMANLMQDARGNLFSGRPEEALELVELAQSFDPDSPTARQWEVKIKRQLAGEWLDRAHDLSSDEDLDEALAAYEKALAYDPANPQAKLGISRILLKKNYREGRSKSYYNEGLEALRGYYLPQAENSFSKSRKYKENDRAEQREQDVEALLIEERVGLAQDFEAQKLFFAARTEYRLALLIDPDDDVARDGYDRMDREVRVRRGLDDAEMDVRRGDLGAAEETVADIEPLSEEQDDEIADLRGQIEDASSEGMYQEALELERDYRYPEAIAAYTRVLDENDGYYADADSRKRTLEDFVARAERLYATVLEPDSDEAALRALREIDVFWPEYKDVPDRITAYVRRGNDLFRKARGAQDPSEALPLLEELEAFWPSYPGLEEWLGELRQGQGQR